MEEFSTMLLLVNKSDARYQRIFLASIIRIHSSSTTTDFDLPIVFVKLIVYNLLGSEIANWSMKICAEGLNINGLFCKLHRA
jgi:hypothetical protein